MVTIYNNSVSSGQWDTRDPKDAKIVALTTIIDELVKQQIKLAALVTQSNPRLSRSNNFGGSQQDGNRIQPIDEWRFTKGEAGVEKDGKPWWWCLYHVLPGKYDGSYNNLILFNLSTFHLF